MNMRSFAFLIVLSFFLTACQEERNERIDLNFEFDFYPLEVGQTKVFELDSVIFTQQSNRIIADTVSIFVRERILDTLRDNAGKLIYKVEYAEAELGASYQVKSIFTAQLDELSAIRDFSNLRFVPLIFPPEIGTEWDGNIFFNPSTEVRVGETGVQVYKGWSYSIKERYPSFQVGDIIYNDVIEVEMANLESILELRQANAFYAKGIGLVFEELLILDTQCRFCCNGNLPACESFPWDQRTEEGFILSKRLIDIY
ncbi:MAG: hypothetical protein AAFO07_24185 [Bacteroidota bacterium]